MGETAFRPAFAISIDIDHDGNAVHGLYWHENGGVRVSFKNKAGETNRGWADVSAAPTASEAMARIVLRELAEADKAREPPTFQKMMVRLPEIARPRLPSLRKIVTAMDGVLAVNCCPESNSLRVDVLLAEADRVSEAIASAVDTAEGEHCFIIRFVAPQPRKPEHLTN